MTDRYIDPNSGAAPQPGGQVSGGVPVAEDEAEPVTTTTEQTEQSRQTSEPQSGEQVSDSGETEGDSEEETEGDSEEQSEEETEEEQGDSEEETEEEPVEESKDYSALLSKTAPEVQTYMDEHPDEKEAVQAAEAQGQNRKGIANY